MDGSIVDCMPGATNNPLREMGSNIITFCRITRLTLTLCRQIGTDVPLMQCTQQRFIAETRQWLGGFPVPSSTWRFQLPHWWRQRLPCRRICFLPVRRVRLRRLASLRQPCWRRSCQLERIVSDSTQPPNPRPSLPRGGLFYLRSLYNLIILFARR